jgi:hypothetical protein
MKKKEFSQDQLDKIGECCFDCGTQFLSIEQRQREYVVTSWEGVCPLCGENKGLTATRHFNYLRKDHDRRRTH